MSSTVKLIATAVLSLAVGAGASYATLRATATCSVATVPPAGDGSTKAFMAGPDLPLTGPRYK